MPIVDIKGVGKVQFPDQWSHDKIVDAIQNQVIPQYKEHQTKTGFIPALKAAGREALGATETLIGETTGSDYFKKAAEEQRQKAAKTFEPTTEQDIANAQGIFPTAGAYASKYITEPLGGIAGRFGVPIAAGVGAGLAAPELAIGAIGAGALATGVTDLPMEIGENIQRQQEQGKDVNMNTAVSAGLAQAALASVGIPGAGVIAKTLGPKVLARAEAIAPKVATGELTKEEAVKELGGWAKSLAQSSAVNAVSGTGLMVGTEELRRAQAGQGLMTPEEIGETALTATALSPIFGAMHPTGRGAALKTIEKAAGERELDLNKSLDAINAERQRQADIAERAKSDAEFAKLMESAEVRQRIFTETDKPIQTIIDEMTGVSRAPTKVTKSDVTAAINEPSGVRVADPVTGVERELTVGELNEMRSPELAQPKFETDHPVIDKTTLTSLLPELKPNAGIFKALEKIGTIDTEEKLNTLHAKLDELQAKAQRNNQSMPVNEIKLKDIEDAYKQATAERKTAESLTVEPGREATGAGIQDTGGLGRGTADTAGVARPDLGGVDATRPPVSEPIGGASGEPTALNPFQQRLAEQRKLEEQQRADEKAANLEAARAEQASIKIQQDAAAARAEQDRKVAESQAKFDELAAKSDEELPTVDERALEPDVNIEKFEAAKATIGEYVRQKTGVAKNITPEEQISTNQALVALADIMAHIVRQGVRSMGDAVRQARKALGDNAKHIPKEEYFKSYATAIAAHDTAKLRETVAATPKVEPVKAAARPDLEETWKQSGGKNTEEEQSTSLFQSYKEDPEHFIAEKKKGFQHFLDAAQTQLFSSDAGFQNALRRGIEKTGASWDAVKKLMFEASTAQAHHAEGVAHRFLELGGIKYNPELMKFEAFEDAAGSWSGTIDAIKKASIETGVPFGEMEKYAHKALEARRLALDVVPYNERLKERVAAMIADGKRPSDAKKVWDANRKVIHMTPEQIKAGMDLFNKIPQLKEVAAQWDTTRKNVVKFAVDTGLYTQEKAEALLETLAYVPFFRVEQMENRAGPKEFSRGLLDAATDKKFTGSMQEVNNIFDNMERWASYMVRKGVNNKSAQNLTKAALKYLPDEVRKVDRVERGMRENTFSIWENGEKQLYEFKDPMFVHAFTGMESIAIPALEGAAKYANMLRQNIVLNPLFSIGQLSQDSFGAMLTSGLKHPFAIPLEVMKEFAKTLRGTSASHQELKNVAAVGLRDYSATASRYDAEIAAGLREATKWQKFKRPFEKFSMASDNAVRQAIYNRTLLETGGKKMADGRIVGGDKATAVERAFEIINFRRGGANELVSLGRRTIPFFGAYLQSMNVAAKVLSGRGISPTERAEAYRVLASNLAKVMALGFIYNTVISEDEGYKKLDPTVRDRHLVIPGTDGTMMLPLRSDVFTLISKIFPEHMYQMTMAETTEDATKAKKALGTAVSNALLSPTVMPQVIKPLVEVGLNHNMFTGQPIVGQGKEHLETELQYGPNTSQLAKVIGQTGLISPLNVDHILKSYFGYSAGMALMATEGLISQMTGETLPDKTLRDSIASIPGMSAFTSKEFGTKDMNDFYELKALTTKAVASLNQLKEVASPEEVQAYREKNQQLIAANKQVTRISENLSKLKKQERKVIESDMSSTEKQMRLHELKVREHQMVQNITKLRKDAGL